MDRMCNKNIGNQALKIGFNHSKRSLKHFKMGIYSPKMCVSSTKKIANAWSNLREEFWLMSQRCQVFFQPILGNWHDIPMKNGEFSSWINCLATIWMKYVGITNSKKILTLRESYLAGKVPCGMDNGRAQFLCRRQNSMDPPRSPNCNRVAINNSHAHARELKEAIIPGCVRLTHSEPSTVLIGYEVVNTETWGNRLRGNYKPHRSTFLGHQTAWSSGRRFRGIPTLDNSWPQHFGLHCIFCFTLSSSERHPASVLLQGTRVLWRDATVEVLARILACEQTCEPEWSVSAGKPASLVSTLNSETPPAHIGCTCISMDKGRTNCSGSDTDFRPQTA